MGTLLTTLALLMPSVPEADGAAIYETTLNEVRVTTSVPTTKVVSDVVIVIRQLAGSRSCFMGTGTVIDTEGTVLTCGHVVATKDHPANKEDKFFVKLFSQDFRTAEMVPAKLLSYTLSKGDLGLLKIDTNRRLSYRRVAPRSSVLKAGQKVHTWQCPGGENPRHVTMRIHAVNPFLGPANLETNVPSRQGASGSSLLNEQGHIIAILWGSNPRLGRSVYTALDAVHDFLASARYRTPSRSDPESRESEDDKKDKASLYVASSSWCGPCRIFWATLYKDKPLSRRYYDREFSSKMFSSFRIYKLSWSESKRLGLDPDRGVPAFKVKGSSRVFRGFKHNERWSLYHKLIKEVPRKCRPKAPSPPEAPEIERNPRPQGNSSCLNCHRRQPDDDVCDRDRDDGGCDCDRGGCDCDPGRGCDCDPDRGCDCDPGSLNRVRSELIDKLEKLEKSFQERREESVKIFESLDQRLDRLEKRSCRDPRVCELSETLQQLQKQLEVLEKKFEGLSRCECDGKEVTRLAEVIQAVREELSRTTSAHEKLLERLVSRVEEIERSSDEFDKFKDEVSEILERRKRCCEELKEAMENLSVAIDTVGRKVAEVSDKVDTLESRSTQMDERLSSVEDNQSQIQESLDHIKSKLEEDSSTGDDQDNPDPIGGDPGDDGQKPVYPIQIESGISHFVLVVDKDDRGWPTLERLVKEAKTVHRFITVVDKNDVPFYVRTLPQLIAYDMKSEAKAVSRGQGKVEAALLSITRRHW